MTGKRKRDITPKLKSKKQRKRQKTGKGDVFIPAQNNFHHLPEEDSDSDSSVIFDYDSREKSTKGEIVLVESDDENESVIVAISDDDDDNNDDENENEQDGNVKVSKTEKNELAKNEDFIGFGFSSSEEENNIEDEDFSDDGVMSADEHGKVTAKKASSSFPWLKDHDHSEQKEMADWLTMEMKDFVNYISPSSEEIRTRNRLINKLKSSISSYWPETETHVFGSSATDLYLPGSDIDIVIVSRTGDYENRSRLYQLSSYLRHKGLAKNMEVIAKAKVPIIKFVDPESNVNIDVSFERRNGIEAAKKIRRWMTTTPGLRELVLIIKQFLSSRRLNNVHSGGLGGYATIILCYHFLMMHPRVSTNSINITDNLGALLIEFFELYGRNFSYDNLIISLDPRSDLPRYLLKRDYPHLNTNKNPFTIVVQDPSDEDNNITRSSYNLRDLKKAFGGAYQLLVEKCYVLNGTSYKNRLGESILGDIIKYRGKERDFNDDRHKVINDALINHESSEDESDGADGNDKYYYSDITVESDDELQFEKEAESAVHTKKQVEEILGLKGDNPEEDEEEGEDTTKEDEEEDATDMKRSKSNLDKDVRRDYWRQKGLEL
ncbi:topoisomerase I-related protein [Scheffersomyces stipitis CBS 6054]|uniref:polynucleotide adenylyltransferase n=1 Tax=Scheffersomyces stipitis (strain ATCC 58785 / CBS 6054 / NBRC 10063 / NRRL Y-11545) TaxID=322104 RepID=A3GFW2_PICST|nr:topoisomerase I-related protein [Scheffersomyces stipitis CBS 6054]EAZ63829.2 topoisomerase I-related protein [Scheffersomyces stipitis CBS 6054]